MFLRRKKTDMEPPEVEAFTQPETEICPPDGGWGWVVCFAAFLTNFTVMGMVGISGILLIEILDLFNKSLSKTTIIFSVFNGATMFGGLFVSIPLMFKASYRQIMMVGGIIAAASAVASSFAPNVETLIFTYGILVGLSLAVNYFAGNVMLGHYFLKKRALALGIANSGSGFGMFTMNYLTTKIIPFYSVRGTFLLLGGLFLNLTVYGTLCRPLKPVIKQSSDISRNERKSVDKMEEAACLAFEPEDDETDEKYIYIPVYAASIGLNQERAAVIMAIYGVSSIASQLLVGFLADIIHIPTSYLLLATLFSTALGELLIPFCESFETLALCAVLNSIGYNSGISLRIVMTVGILGIEHMTTAYGILTTLIGILYIIYPILNGLVYEATKHFSTVFYLDSGIAFLGVVLSCGIVYAQMTGKFVE